MNPNQDLIDLINLNKLRDANDASLLMEEEKAAYGKLIEAEQRRKMNRLRLKLTPEQMKEVKKREDELLKMYVNEGQVSK